MTKPSTAATDQNAAGVSNGECLAPFTSEIQELRAVGRLFYDRGWSVGTSSNYSVVVANSPTELLVTASGKDKGALTERDFVLVDGTGRPTFHGQPKSSAETLLHCLLAEDEHAGAVLHTHSVWSTVLSDYFAHDRGLVIEGFEMLKGLEGVTTHLHREWLDIFENTQDMRALADTIRDRWQHADACPRHGFLLRQHGLYTWGPTLFAARRHVEIFEFLMECVARKLMLSGNVSGK